MDARSSGGSQQSGDGGGAASPSTGESPHGGGGSGRERRQQLRSIGVGYDGGVDVKALLALDERQRVRLLSLLVQLETQTLAMRVRNPPPMLELWC